MTEEGKKFISRLVMQMAVPCMCIQGLTANLTREIILESGQMLLVPLCCITLNFPLSLLIGKSLKLPRKKLGVFIVMCSMSNSMLVGYAMCTELFGDVCIPYVMLFYMVSTAFTQAAAVSIVQWSGGASCSSVLEIMKMLCTPAVFGVIAGFAFVVLGISLPPIAMSYMKYMANLVSPCALILTGYIIYKADVKSLKISLPISIMMCFRFVISPLIFLVACMILGVEGLARNVFIIEAAMPTLSITAVAASEYGADEEMAATGAALTTIASFAVGT